MHGPARSAVAFILKGYPRLSETFIAQEIRSLEARGVDIRIFSLRRPTDPYQHPIHDEILAPAHYLPEYLHRDPGRVWRAWRAQRKTKHYRAARGIWLADLLRDPSRNRVRRFGQALVLAHELDPDIGHLHAHFLHTPASVARYAAYLTELPWSCSAHAKDIWTSPPWEIREKLVDGAWLVTCTAAGREYLATFAPDPERVALVYHGLDFERFPPPGGLPPANRDGRESSAPVRLLSVGRAVPKKGYPVLLEALSRLPADLHWRFEHVGDGPDLAALARQATRLGIADRVQWRGPQNQRQVLQSYRDADIFVLASLIDTDGDRDGLPNVLMEAQSQGLACLSTTVSAIPELIEDGATGLLVTPGDADAFTDALRKLVTDVKLRQRLGTAGAAHVRRSFGLDSGINKLVEKFGQKEKIVLETGEQDTTNACVSPSMLR